MSDLAPACPRCGRPNPTNDSPEVEVRKLLAEMVRQGVAPDSPKVRRLRELIEGLDEIAERYADKPMGPEVGQSLTVEMMANRTAFEHERDALMDVLREEYKPYFDALHRRFKWRRNLARGLTAAVLIAAFVLSAIVWIRVGSWVVDRVDPSKTNVVLFIAICWSFLGPIVVLGRTEAPLGRLLHRRLTGQDPAERARR